MVSFALRVKNKFKIKGLHNISIDSSSRLRGCKIIIKGKNNTLHIGANVRLRDSEIELDGNNCTLSIGDNTIIGHGCYLSSRETDTGLVIGNECMLSRNVKIMTSDGHDIIRDNQRINIAKGIYISNKVWLADNVTILKGVNVGEHSVIGINSTLTKSVGAHVIAVGNPAKVVHNEVSWSNELTY
ncbi:acyltransferase [Vibrio hepatarius]|uniref:acyltransferase n=1 Tax=Vibrio hepatarius TaxID=171383 RepID=UPI001C084112|nr:acyltransferase [Vibrio hepatarius]MBU2896858.1 acyltransferase [Vibrio hepatarius]